MTTGTSLCILGCGNLGTAILECLLKPFDGNTTSAAPMKQITACVRSEQSRLRLLDRFSTYKTQLNVSSSTDNVEVVKNSDCIILAVNPSDLVDTLRQPGLADALTDKLVISVIAGWTRQKIEATLLDNYGYINGMPKFWVVRTLPNIAATVAQSITAVETPCENLPGEYLDLTNAIFNRIGKVIQLDPKRIDAFTAVGGSTPAFFAVIADALVDAAVAVGIPRCEANVIIAQSMLGSATLLQNGLSPGDLRDQGTSPAGCTIAGLMVLEETGVRGGLSRALREAVRAASLLGVNQ
ncbi:pyrroline-5-carboxylate reductase [Sclerotinia borealis F-4128]|uniref:Pyrroline-5-carboxylate reductase n=1 Tax=Sclerotinia borealis (strain F-4128) TaxID=1432307 RepID=W9CGI8_SCLBF|nr:pyrroline-5-carboxylate reductase [Sclerotinia borealis F-4128]